MELRTEKVDQILAKERSIGERWRRGKQRKGKCGGENRETTTKEEKCH